MSTSLEYQVTIQFSKYKITTQSNESVICAIAKRQINSIKTTVISVQLYGFYYLNLASDFHLTNQFCCFHSFFFSFSQIDNDRHAIDFNYMGFFALSFQVHLIGTISSQKIVCSLSHLPSYLALLVTCFNVLLMLRLFITLKNENNN